MAAEDLKKQRYKLVLSYDGTAYSGWQRQPNALSIQQIVQEKLAILLKRKIPVTGAGRTDAGVHALAQVAHFDHEELLDLYKIRASLNGLLPRDIRVRSVEFATQDFHARFTAVNKIYHYHLNLSQVQDPFVRLYSWHIFEKIDLKLLSECGKLFLGTHDFTSFANEPGAGAAGKNPIRTLKRIDVIEERTGVRMEFEGASFLYKMVRNLTGTIVEVAQGKRNLSEIPDILAARNRRMAGKAAPPQGLFLIRVDYPIAD